MSDSPFPRYVPEAVVPPAARSPLAVPRDPITTFSQRRWIGCVRGCDDALYLPGNLVSYDGGISFTAHSEETIEHLPMLSKPEGALLERPGLSLVLNGWVEDDPAGGYLVRSWRSESGLTHLQAFNAPVNGLRLKRAGGGKLLPACFTREIIEMPGGILLAPAYACFEDDTLLPQDIHSQLETALKTRVFLLRSADFGITWRYHATVACPAPGDPVGEGFNEPAMLRLADGRLLCILRTGHYSPLYACWSADDGLTWSDPLYTGLERGCFPCLRQLADGRLALSFGQRFPAGWSRVTPGGDWPRYEPILPGPGLVCLALSADGGETWESQVVARNMGSCYATFYEAEPGTLFFQCDGYYWRERVTALRPL